MGNSLTKKDIEFAIAILEEEKPKENKEIANIINANRSQRGQEQIGSCRISEIKYRNDPKKSRKKSYTKYIPYSAASEPDVKHYIDVYEIQNSNTSSLRQKHSVKEFLKIVSENPLIVNATEDTRIEFKERFEKKASKLVKPICAFANTKGGFIVYGVKDNGEVVGLDNKNKKEFQNFDLANLATEIQNYFACGMDIKKCTYDIHDKKLGYLYVPPAIKKPVIFIKDHDVDAPKGSILYRYLGQSSSILPEDLNRVIEERIKLQAEEQLPNILTEIFQHGLDNVAIMNTANGLVTGKGRSFQIDESLLKKLDFMKEGEFSEKAGAPTVKIIGEAHVINSETKHEEKEGTCSYSFNDILCEVKKLIPGFNRNHLIKFKQKHKINASTMECKRHQQKKITENNRELTLSKNLYNQKYCYYNEGAKTFTYSPDFIKYVYNNHKK